MQTVIFIMALILLFNFVMLHRFNEEQKHLKATVKAYLEIIEQTKKYADSLCMDKVKQADENEVLTLRIVQLESQLKTAVEKLIKYESQQLFVRCGSAFGRFQS